MLSANPWSAFLGGAVGECKNLNWLAQLQNINEFIKLELHFLLCDLKINLVIVL